MHSKLKNTKKINIIVSSASNRIEEEIENLVSKQNHEQDNQNDANPINFELSSCRIKSLQNIATSNNLEAENLNICQKKNNKLPSENKKFILPNQNFTLENQEFEIAMPVEINKKPLTDQNCSITISQANTDKKVHVILLANPDKSEPNNCSKIEDQTSSIEAPIPYAYAPISFFSSKSQDANSLSDQRYSNLSSSFAELNQNTENKKIHAEERENSYLGNIDFCVVEPKKNDLICIKSNKELEHSMQILQNNIDQLNAVTSKRSAKNIKISDQDQANIKTVNTEKTTKITTSKPKLLKKKSHKRSFMAPTESSRQRSR